MNVKKFVQLATFCINTFSDGVQHSIFYHKTLYFIVCSTQIRKNTFLCLGLNGLLFLGSYFAFQNFVIPIIFSMGAYIDGKNPWITFEKGFTPSSPGDLLAQWTAEVIFRSLWLYPLYIGSLFVNMKWYSKIANEAFLMHHGEQNIQVNIKSRIRDELYKMLLLLILLIEVTFFQMTFPIFSSLFGASFFSSLLNIFGYLISFFLLSLVYSFYIFDYQWTLQGWSLERRISTMEYNWIYFSGFGGVLAITTLYFPQLIGVAVYSLIFPFSILLSIVSPHTFEGIIETQTTSNKKNSSKNFDNISSSNEFIHRLPIFWFPSRIGVFLTRWVNKKLNI